MQVHNSYIEKPYNIIKEKYLTIKHIRTIVEKYARPVFLANSLLAKKRRVAVFYRSPSVLEGLRFFTAALQYLKGCGFEKNPAAFQF